MTTEIWTDEELSILSNKFRIRPGLKLHSQAEDFHFPRKSFLQEGYAPPGGYVKDFGVIWHEGRLHLFHIDGKPGQICWMTGNEISFGHASTSDFCHWIRHPMPLAVGDRPWESEHIWAPYVYKHKELFYLFYMGMGKGQTFVSYATSPDLEQWSRWSGGPISCAVGRDPFVFEKDGRVILCYTGNGFARVSACASRDMLEWEPLPDLLTIPDYTDAESSSLHSLENGYVLWFNDYRKHGEGFRAAYAFSEDPFHFDPGTIREFEFRSNHPELAPSAEIRTTYPFPLSIELIARREQQWFVCYFRWQGDRNRLFFGAIDWAPKPAVIREIIDPAELAIGKGRRIMTRSSQSVRKGE